MNGGASTGVISGDSNNQVDEDACTYNLPSVQTVFNSCSFDDIVTDVNINGSIVHFGNPEEFDTISTPTVTPTPAP